MKKTKFMALLMGALMAMPVVSSCGDDDEDVTPDAPGVTDNYGRSRVKFVATCNPTLAEVANVTVAVKSALNSQTFTLGSKGRASYNYGTSVVPAEYHVTFDVKYKDDYVPEPGKTYDLEMAYTFEMKMYDKEGNLMRGESTAEGGWNLINLQGVEADKLEAVFTSYLSEIFPLTYDFGIYKTQNGGYEMKYPVE